VQGIAAVGVHEVDALAITNGCPDMREITITHASVTDTGVAAIKRPDATAQS
jgi:hypothetical protein